VRSTRRLALPVSGAQALAVRTFRVCGRRSDPARRSSCGNSAYNIVSATGFSELNCVILDVVEVSVGDRTRSDRKAKIYAPIHPGMPKPAERPESGVRYGAAATSDGRRRHNSTRSGNRRRTQ